MAAPERGVCSTSRVEEEEGFSRAWGWSRSRVEGEVEEGCLRSRVEGEVEEGCLRSRVKAFPCRGLPWSARGQLSCAISRAMLPPPRPLTP